MKLPFSAYSLMCSLCFLIAACPSSTPKSDGGAADGSTAGSGASGTGASSTLAGGAATVVVKTAVSPLMATSYDLSKGKFAGQRNNDEFYANFDGTADFGSMYGGDTISLRFGGFFKTGTFACGARAKPNDDYAVQTSLELWTFANAKSQMLQFRGSNAGSKCSITVTKLDATTIEGTYTGKLYSDATTFVEVSGAFHATP